MDKNKSKIIWLGITILIIIIIGILIFWTISNGISTETVDAPLLNETGARI